MDKRNLEFLDLINIISFVVGIMNYQENLTQSDKQELMREVDATTELLLSNINEHLERQDRLLELLLERTKVYDGQ